MKMLGRFLYSIAALIAVALFVLALFAAPPRLRAAEIGDHGFGHVAGHENYSTWKRPDVGGSCCNDADCRPTKAKHDGVNWWAVVDGSWVKVPPEKVLKDPSEDGVAHICASAYSKEIYCFRPPGGQT